jgi:hypothetical protein
MNVCTSLCKRKSLHAFTSSTCWRLFLVYECNKMFKKFAVCPFELVLRYASLKGLRLWNLQEKVSHMLSLIVSYSYHVFLPVNRKQWNVSYDKILRTLINTVVRRVRKGRSKSRCIWSRKRKKDKCIGQPTVPAKCVVAKWTAGNW